MSGRPKANKILTLIAFLSVLAAAGCGTYSPVAPSHENNTSPDVENPIFVKLSPASEGSGSHILNSAEVQMVSAEEGGTVRNGYFSLYFPPGALEADTEITIEMPQFPSAIVRLGPHGIQFMEDVIISLPLKALESKENNYNLLWFNEESGLWENIGGYVEGGFFKAHLKHFSDYGLEPNN